MRATAGEPGRAGRLRLPRLAAALCALVCVAAAADPAERLSDPAKEAHARTLFQQFRCVVCQAESIDDSEAPIAHDLRQIVREQVAAGRTDAEIKHYLVARYGEFVLLRPSFSWLNALLWFTPLIAAGAGGAVIVARLSRARPAPEPPLTPEEEAKVAALTQGHGFAAPPPEKP